VRTEQGISGGYVRVRELTVEMEGTHMDDGSQKALQWL